MSEPGWKNWEELREIIRLLRPSYEEQQLERYVKRECIAADIAERCHQWGLDVPLENIRAIATDMVLRGEPDQ